MTVMLSHAPCNWALDSTSAQAYCDQVQKAAQNARTNYIKVYQPSNDPVKVFDDATGACLDFISNFDIGFSFTIPSLGDIDAFLRRMAMTLLQRACQAATDQFNRAVNDALQSVNSTTGVAGVTATNTGSGVAVSSNTSSVVQSTVQTATDRVINLVK